MATKRTLVPDKPKSICNKCEHIEYPIFASGNEKFICNAKRKLLGYSVIFGTKVYDDSKKHHCTEVNKDGNCKLFKRRRYKNGKSTNKN